MKKVEQVYIVFDGPPSHESGRFVEVEDENGASVGFIPDLDHGADAPPSWTQDQSGLWRLGPFLVDDDHIVRNDGRK